METGNPVDAAKVRALDKLTTLLEVLTEIARAGLKELSDRSPNPTEAGAARRARS